MAKLYAVAAVLMLIFGMALLDDARAEVKFDYGADVRLRQEIWDNVVGLDTLPTPNPTAGNNDRNFFRLRLRLWGSADFDPNVGVYGRITSEPKYHLGPYENPGGDPSTSGKSFDQDEIVFDNLYFKANNIGGLPIDVKIGRQDFLGPDAYGEGFLIMDGTPGDGSRTFYFNAAKLSWRITDKNKLDFVYITDPKTDIFLPSLHPALSGSTLYVDNKKLLTGSDEQGFVVYSKNKIGDNATVDAYYIWKKEDPIGATRSLDLNTVGARATYTIDNWNFRGEYAHQFGEYDGGRDRSGDGGYLFFGRQYPKVTLKPGFDFGYVYLSGDKNPQDKKGTYQQWNPLFSRNPYWNESFIYTLINETAADGGPIPGYWTNLQLLMLKFNLSLSEQTNLILSYQHLWAAQKTYGLNPALFSNSGKDRGHLPTALLAHKFSKNFDGFLQLEYFAPGDFYSDAAKSSWFFRWQLQYKL